MTISSAPRDDIQGLRAIAVGLVVADHLVGYPRGGFVGVDIFFVISGFLITGLLLRERASTGRISFRAFYIRRARRILPVAALVLALTVAASWLIFRTGRAVESTIDAILALLFVSNWRFAALGTDYLHGGDAVSPVQHYWSLAVEEQFYLVWPWLILIAFGIAGRVAWRSWRVTVGLVVGSFTAASFVFAMAETSASPTLAYFSTFSRGWELGVGALIAVASPLFTRLPSRLRTVLSWAGISALAISALAISPDSAFPAPWALLPVLATALVIAVGTGEQPRFMPVLANPVSRYLGDISYSLYLWHFPVIVLASALLPHHGLRVELLLAAVILLLSIASFHLMENPIRTRTMPRSRPRIAMTAIGASAVLAVIIGAIASVTVPMGNRDHAVQTEPVALTAESLARLQAEAVSATAWPELQPSIDDLADSMSPEWTADGCLDTSAATFERCSYGDPSAPRLAVLMGDSVAISWLPGLRIALDPAEWQIQVLTMGECPAITMAVRRATTGEFSDECFNHQREATAWIAQNDPDLIVMTTAQSAIYRLTSGATGQAALDEWSAGTETMLTELLASSSAHIALLTSPPTTVNVQECATRVNGPDDCLGTPEPYYFEIAEAERDAIAALPNASRVERVETLSWFCTADLMCPPYVGHVPTYADTAHLTAAYSRELAPLLARALARD